MKNKNYHRLFNGDKQHIQMKRMNKKSKIFLFAIIIAVTAIIIFLANTIKTEYDIHKELERMKLTDVVEYNNAYYEEVLPKDLKKYNLKEDVKSDIDKPLNVIANNQYTLYSSKSIQNSSVIICENNNNYFYAIFCNYTSEKEITEILKTYGIEKADDIKKIKAGKIIHNNKKYIDTFYNQISNCKIDKNTEGAEYLYDIKVYNNTNIPIFMSKYRKDNKEYFYISFSYYSIN